MNWRNLETQECPNCGNYLDDPNEHDVLVCTFCEFAIGEEKMKEIINNFN